MTIRQKIELIRDYFKTNFAACLTLVNSSLTTFTQENIIANLPNEPTLIQLCFYLDLDRENDTTTDFNIIIQVQLPSIDIADSWDYQQAIKDCFMKMDPCLIDAMILATHEGDNWPPLENNSGFILFKLNYQNEIDDCES